MLFSQNRNVIFSLGYQIIEDNNVEKIVQLTLSM